MKYQTVDYDTDLKRGDEIIVSGEWAEIYHITDDGGINTSRGWICRSHLYKKESKYTIDPLLPLLETEEGLKKIKNLLRNSRRI